MDWSHVVEYAWEVSVPVEVVPDLVAWVGCTAVALRCVKFVVTWRPRTCRACVVAWLAWLGWHVFGVDGYKTIEATQHRGAIALEVTDRFAQSLVGLIRAWTDFFLPFWSDVARWAIGMWRQLSVRQRLAFMFSIVCSYTVLEAYRKFRKHKDTIMRVLFHASFLIGGPVVWHLCGLLPSDWLPQGLNLMVTAWPTIFSLAALCRETPGKEASLHRSRSSQNVDNESVVMQRRWLSYWSCWPLLAFLEAAVQAVPRLLPGSRDAAHLQAELQRGLLTFVVWLQFWQGSNLLQFSLQTLLHRTSLIERFAGFFGASGMQALRMLSGTASSTVALPRGASWSVFQLLGKMTRRLWLLGVLALVLLVITVLVTWAFYQAVSLLSTVVTMMLWCFAAADTADTLTHDSREFFARKLAFWVLAMLWEALTRIPYIGRILRLFTPIAFSLWLVAGETMLRRVALPLIVWAGAPLQALMSVGSLVRTWAEHGSRTVGDDASSSDEVAAGVGDDVVGDTDASGPSTVRAAAGSAETGGTGEGDDLAGTEETTDALPCRPMCGDAMPRRRKKGRR